MGYFKHCIIVCRLCRALLGSPLQSLTRHCYHSEFGDVLCYVLYCKMPLVLYVSFFDGLAVAVAAVFCCSLVFVQTFQRRSDINKRAQKRTPTSKNTFIVRIFLECFLYRIHLSVVLLLLSLTFYSLFSFFFFSNEIVSFGNKKARHNNLS